MKEYIERESVIAFLENMSASRYLIQCLENKEKFPASNVEPIKYGKWEFNTHQAPDEKAYFCSVCAEGGSDYGTDKYCPNCGARMNKEK